MGPETSCKSVLYSSICS